MSSHHSNGMECEIFHIFKRSAPGAPAQYRAVWRDTPVIMTLTPTPGVTDIENMNLCHGTLETDLPSLDHIQERLSEFYIERLGETFIYRSRNCSLLIEKTGLKCSFCSDLFDNVPKNISFVKQEVEKQELKQVSLDIDTKYEEEYDVDENDDFKQSNIETNVVSDHDDSDYEAKPKKRRKFVKKITKIEVKKTFKHKNMKKIPDNYEDCVKMLKKMSERWKDGKKPKYVARETKCRWCEMIFPTAMMEELHFRTVHSKRFSGESLFATQTNICEHCGKVFETGRKLYNHVQWFHNEKEKKCELCGEDFACYREYRNHVKRHTKKRRPPPAPCPECGKFIIDMKMHMKTMHATGEENMFQCDVCHKAFASNQKLREHIVIHSEERPFKCRFCDFGSKSAGNLRKHEQQRHATEYQLAKN